jgi:hypothetical protein
MIKPDEVAARALVWRMATELGVGTTIINTDDVAEALSIPPKRMYYLVGKWSDRDLVDYGVSARGFWLTTKGLEAFKPSPNDIRNMIVRLGVDEAVAARIADQAIQLSIDRAWYKLQHHISELNKPH